MNALEQYSAGVEIGGVEIGANGPRARQSMSGNIQRIMAGLPRQAITAGSSAELQVNTSEPFRPERLVLSTAAQALDVLNIRIGTKSLNVTSNPISGNCFSEQAIGTHVVGYTAQAGVGFVVSAQNNTAGSITSGGGVFGLALN